MSSADVGTVSNEFWRGCHGSRKTHGAGGRPVVAFGEQYEFKAGQLMAPGLDFAAVKRLRGDKHLGGADGHSCFDWFRPERGKER